MILPGAFDVSTGDFPENVGARIDPEKFYCARTGVAPAYIQYSTGAKVSATPRRDHRNISYGTPGTEYSGRLHTLGYMILHNFALSS